jgi:DNA-binding transcriptional ArsR family regulator
MAIEDWDLNLFTSDPTLLGRGSDEEYERAAAALERIADPKRLRLLHALSLGEDTPQRAAVWAGVEQSYAERELATLALAGVVERRESPRGPIYVPRDGHLVVELHVALAHGREQLGERHPRLLRRRARVTVRGRRAG